MRTPGCRGLQRDPVGREESGRREQEVTCVISTAWGEGREHRGVPANILDGRYSNGRSIR